ncbi:MAG: SRPBCC domain-containing protein [Actinomycetota bacterium]
MRTERSIELPVEPDDVWSALVDDDLLSDWLGDEAHVDPVPGGAVEVREGDDHRRGVVERVEPGRHLGLRWWSVDEPDETSEVDLVVAPVPGGTRLTVIERRAVPAVFASADARLVMLAATACRVQARATVMSATAAAPAAAMR